MSAADRHSLAQTQAMETLLVWGAGSQASFEVARALAAQGHRLLVVGDCPESLQALDASLAQSELHRYHGWQTGDALVDWVTEQDVGLHGLVLFPPTPERGDSLLLPLAVNAESVHRAVLEPIEVIRQLVLPLRRGLVPNRALLVLEWVSPLDPAGTTHDCLTGLWRNLLPPLAAELSRHQVQLNLLRLGAVLDDRLRDEIAREAPDTATATAVLDALAQRSPGGLMLSLSDVAAMVRAWVSSPLSALSGQCIEYPQR